MDKQTLHAVSRITAGCQTFIGLISLHNLFPATVFCYGLFYATWQCVYRYSSKYMPPMLKQKFSLSSCLSGWMCFQRDSSPWVDISRARQMSSLLPQGALRKLIWHLKTLNMVEWIQMHSLTEVIETWRTASSYQVLYYFRAILTQSRKCKGLLPRTKCSLQHKENQIRH